MMKTTRTIAKNSLNVFFLASLCILPSCAMSDWVKEKLGMTESKKTHEQEPAAEKKSTKIIPENESDVLAKLGDDVIMTVQSLKKEKNDIMESDPMIKKMFEGMDPAQMNQVDRSLVDGFANQALIDKYIEVKKHDQTQEYKNDFKRAEKQIRQVINQKYFGQDFPASISDKELKEFYDQNKDAMPNLWVSRGGIKTVGISFENEADANSFASKVNAANGDFAKAAQEAGITEKVKDFNLVNEQSIGIDPTLREKIINIEKVPATQVVKVDDSTFWVIRAAGKEAPTYRSFDEVKEGLRDYLEKDKRNQVFESALGKLRDEYQLEINEEYFAPKGEANKPA